MSVSQSKMIADKISSFKRALRSGYNVETVSLDSTEFLALISSTNGNPDVERKSFSTLVDNSCKIGDDIYWEADGSHWIITERSSTEKAIFQGYIDKALYELEWKDLETGKVYSQWACVVGPKEKSIADGTKNSIVYDMFSESLHILIPKSAAGVSLLSRYFEIMVNKRKWLIEVIDDVTNADLIGLQLIEVAKDREIDSETIVNGNLPINFLITSSLDNITELVLDNSITLNPVLYKNGVVQDLNAIVSVENGTYINNIITFDILGVAIVEITYPNIDVSTTYTINIVESSIAEIPLTQIIGDSTLKTLNSTTYTLINLLNGVNVPLDGSWVVNSQYMTIVNQTSSVLIIKATTRTGITVIKYIHGIDEYEKEIKIIPMFGGN